MAATLALQTPNHKHCYAEFSHCSAMHIGKRVQRLMLERGISNTAMAAHCGVTPGAVSNWFASGRISKVNLVLACRLLDVDVEALIEGEVGERNTHTPLSLTDEERDIILTLREKRAHYTLPDGALESLKQRTDALKAPQVERKVEERRNDRRADKKRAG
jgi:transcriptional regulator with XRE-family HTH domain